MPPFSVCRGRNGVLYGVNGGGRGFRYHPSIGRQPIGMTPPSTAPTVSAFGDAASGKVVDAVSPSGYDPGSIGGGTNLWRKLRFTTPPTLEFSKGGGSGADGYATVSAGSVNGLFINTGGSGYSQNPIVSMAAGDGTGASAIAYASGEVFALELANAGSGYTKNFTLGFIDAGPIKQAAGTAILSNGRIDGFTITDPGAGYGSTPNVSLKYDAEDATFSFSLVNGKVESITVNDGGTGYTSAPTVTIDAPGGTGTTAAGTATVSGGKVTKVSVTNFGSGYSTTPSVAFSGGGGTDALATAQIEYGLSMSVVTGGSNYLPGTYVIQPSGHTGNATTLNKNNDVIVFTSSPTGGGVSALGNISIRGFYTAPASVRLIRPAGMTKVTGTVSLSVGMAGKYLCCYRFVDSTSDSLGGPIPSSISPFAEVDCRSGASGLSWSFDTSGADERATHVELWRSTSDQALSLYRVAKLPLTRGLMTHTDVVPDSWLSNEARADFLAMPVVLPTGQVNARRFGLPPTDMAVICQFQDRMWYACDTSGQRPNSLMFSEIDEPESVPDVNELVIQENSRGTDGVVALVPLGSALLVAQGRNLYRVEYKALPVLDAAVSLVAARGALNDRCWDVFGEVAAMADASGIYLCAGGTLETISDPIANFWKDGIVDLTKSELFSVRYDTPSSVLRFYYCATGDSGPAPKRALCFSTVTKCWWEETYDHTVTAHCFATLSGKPTLLTATYGEPSAPSAPPQVAASAGDARVTLAWTAPANQGGSAVSSYRVEQSTDAGATWSTVVSLTGDSLSYTVQGLTNGTDYQFRVTAINSAGASPVATAGAMPMAPAGVPAAPTALTATAGNSQVSLSWTAPAGTITGYAIEQRVSGGAWIYIRTVTTTSAAMDSLVNGRAYDFRVSAISAAGRGAASSSATATPTTGASVSTAGAPTDVAAAPLSTRATVYWTPPESNGGGKITAYRVERSSNGGSTWTTVTSTAPAGTGRLEYLVTGLTNGTSYIFRVAAINAAGLGTYSTASATVVPATRTPAPSAPQNLVAAPGYCKVRLSWVAPASGTVDFYNILILDGTGGKELRNDRTTATSYVASQLTNGREYVFRVTPVKLDEDSQALYGPSAETPASSPSDPTLIVQLPAVTGKALSIHWAADGLQYLRYVASGGADEWKSSADGVNWEACAKPAPWSYGNRITTARLSASLPSDVLWISDSNTYLKTADGYFVVLAEGLVGGTQVRRTVYYSNTGETWTRGAVLWTEATDAPARAYDIHYNAGTYRVNGNGWFYVSETPTGSWSLLQHPHKLVGALWENYETKANPPLAGLTGLTESQDKLAMVYSKYRLSTGAYGLPDTNSDPVFDAFELYVLENKNAFLAGAPPRVNRYKLPGGGDWYTWRDPVYVASRWVICDSKTLWVMDDDGQGVWAPMTLPSIDSRPWSGTLKAGPGVLFSLPFVLVPAPE
jgi:fibronectin type 3 domain-containing protein